MPGARTKLVNVKTIVPIHTLNPPLSGTYKKIKMTTGDILKCLCKRAIVDEILPDGSLVRLNIGNYYVNHTPAVVTKPEEDKVPDTPTQSSDVTKDEADKDQVVETATEDTKEEIVEEDKTDDTVAPAIDNATSTDSVSDSEVVDTEKTADVESSDDATAPAEVEAKAETIKVDAVKEEVAKVEVTEEKKETSTTTTKKSTSKSKKSSTKKSTTTSET